MFQIQLQLILFLVIIKLVKLGQATMFVNLKLINLMNYNQHINLLFCYLKRPQVCIRQTNICIQMDALLRPNGLLSRSQFSLFSSLTKNQVNKNKAWQTALCMASLAFQQHGMCYILFLHLSFQWCLIRKTDIQTPFFFFFWPRTYRHFCMQRKSVS